MGPEDRLNNPLVGLLWFIVIVGVLYAIFAWTDGHLGYWGFPIALAVASIPTLVHWLLKRRRDRK
jgi:hypothetical protein